MTEDRKERARKLRQFALAVSDPTSPTFSNNVDSYIAGFELDEKAIETIGLPTVTRRAHRTRYNRFVLKTIKAIQEQLAAGTGLTKYEYMQLLLKREADYARRGIPGDAAASARLLQFLGKALGHLADAPVVDPNAPKQPLLSGEELATAFITAAERLQRLRLPNPLPATATIIEEEK